MKINIENLHNLVRIKNTESDKKVITKVINENYDDNNKLISREVQITEIPKEESIDTVKYDIISKLLDVLLYPPLMVEEEEKDNSDSWKVSDDSDNSDELTPFKIAYNTLIEYNILKK